MKQRDWKLYGLWILFVEAVGALPGWLTREGAAQYEQTIVQPPLSPPGIVFPIVWGILFALMGVSAARVDTSPASAARSGAAPSRPVPSRLAVPRRLGSRRDAGRGLHPPPHRPSFPRGDLREAEE